MTVAAIPAAEAVAGGSAGAGAVAGRAGAGKVVDAKVVSSRPLRTRNTRTAADRASDAGTGAGLGQLLGNGRGGSSAAPGHSNARRLLVAEFTLCMVVLAFSPLTGKSPSASAFMKRGSAIMGVFFLLGLTATAGRGAARASAGFGGLVTLVLLISERSVFTKLATKFQPGVGEDDTDRGGLDAQDDLDDQADQGIGGSFGGPLGVPDPGLPPTTGLTPLYPAGPLGNGIR